MAPCPIPGVSKGPPAGGAHGGTGMGDDEGRVIGNVELRAAGEPVELPPQLAKALAVLVAALVAGRSATGVTRSELTDALWPAAPDADRLSAVVSKLRTALGRVGLTV